MKTRTLWMIILTLSTVIAGAVGWSARLPQAAAAPSLQLAWPTVALSLLADGFSRPVHVTHAGDASGRLFVVEQGGRIRIIEEASGSVLPDPFLDIAGRVRSPDSGGGNEEGLLSVAFPPDFASQGIFYVYYTRLDGNNQVSRFYLSADPDLADADSEEPIISFEHPINTNHNGGQLAFGPDGYLYIGTGDGGGGGDPNGNAQNPDSLLGKILRIDVSISSPSPYPTGTCVYLPVITGGNSDLPYRIPPDNPYINTPGYRPEIWALGLRNPWRFAFDRQTGDLFIGDVGQGNIEEIDFQPATSAGGENYGWKIMEGAQCYGAATCDQTGLVLPVVEYDHSAGCSVTGGMVYRGAEFPGLQGIYFYGDYCSGTLWGLQNTGSAWESQLLLSTSYNLSSFGENEAGELFVADLGGAIYRVEVAP